MTHLDLRELEGLLARATPGPWIEEFDSVVNREAGDEMDWDIAEVYAGKNRALIVAAVNALPSLIADLREARERNAWRAIENAPKDGTWIIGYWRSSDVMETVFYSSADTWESVLGNTDAQLVSPPTHWFPLPDAPDYASESGG